MNYCQIPRGATACTNTQVLSTGSPGARPTVLLPRQGESSSTSAPMSGPTSTGFANRSTTASPSVRPKRSPIRRVRTSTSGPGPDGDAVDGPGDSLSYVNGLSSVGTFFTNASLGGAAVQSFATLSTAQQSDATVGLFGGNPVVVTDNFQDIVRYGYHGSVEPQ